MCHGSDGPNANTIPLHISIRFDDNSIVLNSKESNNWGNEMKLPQVFRHGQDMDIRVRVHDSHFEISANHQQLARYDHRINMDRINHMYVEGPLSMHVIVPNGRVMNQPYQADHDVSIGRRVFMSCLIRGDANRVAFNLLTPNGDIALHLNPRFGEREVVRNTLQGGAWGREEKGNGWPNGLERGRVVDVLIHHEQQQFKVFINDQDFCTFARRHATHERISRVAIDGDVDMIYAVEQLF
jgi:hypothetical protein